MSESEISANADAGTSVSAEANKKALSFDISISPICEITLSGPKGHYQQQSNFMPRITKPQKSSSSASSA
jgi:hypothetical protein